MDSSLVSPVLAAVVVALVAFVIGLSKGGMGAILVVLVTPLLSQVMPVRNAISLALPLLLFADIFAIRLYWKQWDMRYIRQMLPIAALGVVIGSVLLWVLPDLTLRRVLGLFTLSFVVYRLLADRLQSAAYSPRAWHAYAAGGASGLGSALANTGAPPFTAYLLLQDMTPQVFAGTTTLFFAVVNLLKLPGVIVGGIFDINDLLQTLWVLPLIPLGVWLGRWMIQRIDKLAFERLLLVLLFAASLILLLT